MEENREEMMEMETENTEFNDYEAEETSNKGTVGIVLGTIGVVAGVGALAYHFGKSKIEAAQIKKFEKKGYTITKPAVDVEAEVVDAEDSDDEE